MRPLIALLLLLGACRTHAPKEAFWIGSAFETLEKHRIAGDEPLKVTPLFENDDHSVSLVQVNGDLKPHRHDRHDEVAIVLEGSGTFTIEGTSRELKPGDVVTIPRGAVHSFVNKGPGATAVVSIFSPKFDGKDRVFVDARP
jgi:quercetin dioxygenase-like cupin family protein